MSGNRPEKMALIQNDKPDVNIWKKRIKNKQYVQYDPVAF